MTADFTFVDGERLVRFGDRAISDAAELLAGRGFSGYVLMASKRAVDAAPEIADAGADVLHVPEGQVPDAAAAVRDGVKGRPIVALGGGRVVDAAKAIGGADQLRVAAIPTTLSGAEMTSFHRMPKGVTVFRLLRPSLVISVPELMASQPMPALASSAMNALGHAIESLYVPLANPITNMTALRACGLLAEGLDGQPPAPKPLALGALLAGYSVGITGFALHHALCQTIVRQAGTSHAQTNAVMLPHTVKFMAERTPEAIAKLSVAIGGGGDADGAVRRLAQFAERAGVSTLSGIGFQPKQLPEVLDTAMARGDMQANTPGGVGEGELRSLVEEAL